MMRALCTRMGGIPKVFQEDDSEEHRRLVDAYVCTKFEGCFEKIAEHAPQISEKFSECTVLEWLERFPKAKADKMWASWIKNPTLRIGYKCFVKKEKCVLDRAAARQELYQESAIIVAFLKYDPRGISVPEEEMRTEAGPWANGLNQAMYGAFYQQIYYNPGNTPAGTSRWFADALVKVQSGEWKFALAVQGDDSLYIYKRNGKLVILCADMSRYDMSQRVSHLHMAWKLIDYLRIPPCRVRREAEQQYRARKYHTSLGTVIVEGTMASGDFVTITINSLILICSFISWDELDFEDHMAKLGFAVTFKESTMENLLQVDFLQCRPWLTQGGYRVFGPKPGRIMARFFWTDKTYSDNRKYLMELKGMVIGLWPLASHIPIINDLLRNLIELLLDIEPVKRQFEGPEELQRWFEGSSEEESEHTEDEMCQLYSITYFDLKLLRQRCRNWNFDGRIDNTRELTATVEKIARVDLE